jgi:hypothetical protein
MRPCRTQTRVMLGGQRVDLGTHEAAPKLFLSVAKGNEPIAEIYLGVGGRAVMRREATSPSIKSDSLSSKDTIGYRIHGAANFREDSQV